MENDVLRLNFSSKGGEIQSIYLKTKNREILWSGDSKIWPRRAPVLFPIVGKLKDDAYQLNGKSYKLTQHGFARDLEHEEIASGEFVFSANEITKKHYPFEFVLKTKYTLDKNKIHIRYTVENHSDEVMPFSLGAHPGFSLTGNAPLRVEFEHKEAGVYYLNNGLVDFSHAHPAELMWTLKAESFKNDALVFKNLKSKWVKLYEEDLILTMHLSKIPFFGLWSKATKEAIPFICLEPWWGVADTTTTTGNFLEKVGVQNLAPRSFEHFDYILEINL